MTLLAVIQKTEEQSKGHLYCPRESVTHHRERVGRNMGVKCTACEDSEGIEDNVIEKWRKRGTCYFKAESYVVSYSYVKSTT